MTGARRTAPGPRSLVAVAALMAAGFATDHQLGGGKAHRQGRHRQGQVLLVQRLPRRHRPAHRQRRRWSTASRPAASSTSPPRSRSCAPSAEADGQKTLHRRRRRPRRRHARCVSAAFHDEPTDRGAEPARASTSRSVGNHEFDEGVTELLRMQHGGCHPTDGCQDGDGFAGADFPYLAANVVYKTTGQPILPPFSIQNVGGVRGRLRRHDARGHPVDREPGRHHDRQLPRRGRDGQQVRRGCCGHGRRRRSCCCIHEGGPQSTAAAPNDPSGCASFAGAITADRRRPATRVRPGRLRPHAPVRTSARCRTRPAATSWSPAPARYGQMVTDITVTLEQAARRLRLGLGARNVIVENGIRNPDGTWQRTAPSGPFVPQPGPGRPGGQGARRQVPHRRRAARQPQSSARSPPTSPATSTTPQARARSATSSPTPSWPTRASAGAQIALMNPGGIRADLAFANSPGGEAPGQVTYGEAFTVQPFNNLVTTQTFTGAQIKDVLEQQFAGFAGQTSTLDPPGLGGLHLHLRHRRGRREPGQQHGAQRRRRSTRPPPTG